MKFLLAILSMIAAVAFADPEDPVLPPTPWPAQHTHLEVRGSWPRVVSSLAARHPLTNSQFSAQIQYTIDGGAICEKPVWYDYTNLRKRITNDLLPLKK